MFGINRRPRPPKPPKRGPGRPPGSKNRPKEPATSSFDVLDRHLSGLRRADPDAYRTAVLNLAEAEAERIRAEAAAAVPRDDLEDFIKTRDRIQKLLKVELGTSAQSTMDRALIGLVETVTGAVAQQATRPPTKPPGGAQ